MSQVIDNLHIKQVKWTVLFSCFIGLILDTMVNNGQFDILFPPVSLLIVLFWVIEIQHTSHLFVAFFLGVLSDVLFQTVLGTHAVLFALIVFLLLRIRSSFKNYPVWHQSIVIVVYIYIYQILGFIFFDPVFSDDSGLLFYFLTPLMVFLLWPIIRLVLMALIISKKTSH